MDHTHIVSNGHAIHLLLEILWHLRLLTMTIAIASVVWVLVSIHLLRVIGLWHLVSLRLLWRHWHTHILHTRDLLWVQPQLVVRINMAIHVRHVTTCYRLDVHSYTYNLVPHWLRSLGMSTESVWDNNLSSNLHWLRVMRSCYRAATIRRLSFPWRRWQWTSCLRTCHTNQRRVSFSYVHTSNSNKEHRNPGFSTWKHKDVEFVMFQLSDTGIRIMIKHSNARQGWKQHEIKVP